MKNITSLLTVLLAVCSIASNSWSGTGGLLNGDSPYPLQRPHEPGASVVIPEIDVQKPIYVNGKLNSIQHTGVPLDILGNKVGLDAKVDRCWVESLNEVMYKVTCASGRVFDPVSTMYHPGMLPPSLLPSGYIGQLLSFKDIVRLGVSSGNVFCEGYGCIAQPMVTASPSQIVTW